MTPRDRFCEMLEHSKRIVGFTGAGVSTESGIADYRSQGGIWENFTPVYLDEFIASKEKRRLYWQRKQAMWQSLKPATPGPAHYFFSHLFNQEKLKGLITQNIDGLHEKSGLPGEVIVNLHGTSLEIVCLSCGDVQPAQGFMDRLELTRESPVCDHCNGLLKPNTISFGQNLNTNDLMRAEKLVRNCDLLIAAGSTLIVHPAATFPVTAKQSGARLVIITLSATPLDDQADLVINEPLGQFLKDLF
ncbi:MAG: Sir2 family NAD-dependent protein deacetylase [Pseudomonadota bacterium]